MPAPRDHYEVLQIGRRASTEEIRRAYHRLARRWHPDVTADPAAHEGFRAANEAYRVLSDPVSRARYDRSVAGPAAPDRVRWAAAAGTRPGHARDPGPRRGPDSVVYVTVELTGRQALAGARRLVCLRTGDGVVTLEVAVPPGVHDGQRLRLTGVPVGDGFGREADVWAIVRVVRGLTW